MKKELSESQQAARLHKKLEDDLFDGRPHRWLNFLRWLYRLKVRWVRWWSAPPPARGPEIPKIKLQRGHAFWLQRIDRDGKLEGPEYCVTVVSIGFGGITVRAATQAEQDAQALHTMR